MTFPILPSYGGAVLMAPFLFGPARGAAPSPSWTPNPASVLFNGDFSTGNFSQWDGIQNKYFNDNGSAWDAFPPQYPATVVTDATYGYACRMELRQGDYPGFPSGDRTALQGPVIASTNDVRWYEWATKFDTSFPNSHASWCNISSFYGSGVQWNVSTHTGEFTLILNRQSSPEVYIGEWEVCSFPFNRGTWNHITMRTVHSASDTVGKVRVWLNHNPVTLQGGVLEFTGRTMVPGVSTTYFKQGIYRDEAIVPTDILYHTGFRACSAADGLSWDVPGF